MATLLGTPYERGQSDVIVSRLVDAPIAEGLIVADAGDGKVEAFGKGKIPYGVMGANEVVGASVVLLGLKVWVQADDTCEATVGGEVFVTTDGKVIHEAGDSNENIPVKAEFASATIKEDGVVENVSTKAYDVKCALINFVGGF